LRGFESRRDNGEGDRSESPEELVPKEDRAAVRRLVVND
jgi:hypothetical protein